MSPQHSPSKFRMQSNGNHSADICFLCRAPVHKLHLAYRVSELLESQVEACCLHAELAKAADTKRILDTLVACRVGPKSSALGDKDKIDRQQPLPSGSCV